jgi:hypothetical protein
MRKPFWRYLAGVCLLLMCLPLGLALLCFLSTPVALWGIWFCAALAIATGYCLWKGMTLLLRKPRASPPRWAGWKWGILKAMVAVPVVATVLLALFMVCVSISMHRGAGPFDRAHMEHIIEQVSQKQLKEPTDFFVDSAGNLQPWNWANNSPPTIPIVSADPKEGKELIVKIMTVDNGHAGNAGFIYCSDYAVIDNSWLSEERIDSHWVRYYDNNQ